MKPKPWPHQLRALDFVRQRAGSLLALEMGTGKTRVAVMRIEDLVDSGIANASVLIFCPKAVIATWRHQLDEWMSQDARRGLIVSAHAQSSTKRRLDLIEQDASTAWFEGRVHAVILNYEATRAEGIKEFLLGRKWWLVICDESQAIKSHSSQVSKFLAKLESVQRLCLTGTPTPHSPLDWFGQMRFLLPDVPAWKRWAPFRANYAIEVPLGRTGVKKITGYRNLHELEQRVAPYVMQVKSEDVLDLPGVQHVRRELDLGKNERKAYQGILDELFAEIDDGVVLTANNVLDRLLKCQQITGGAVKQKNEMEGERRVWLGSSKRDELAQLLTEIPATEPVAVFARFRSDLDQIHDACREVERASYELSGRMDELEAWKKADNGEVIAVQIQSGGAGIDLTRARFVIYWSVGTSLGDYEQSLKRAHRPGQTRPVQYVHLIARDTIDETCYAALDARRDLVEESLRHVRAAAERRDQVRSRGDRAGGGSRAADVAAR